MLFLLFRFPNEHLSLKIHDIKLDITVPLQIVSQKPNVEIYARVQMSIRLIRPYCYF